MRRLAVVGAKGRMGSAVIRLSSGFDMQVVAQLRRRENFGGDAHEREGDKPGASS